MKFKIEETNYKIEVKNRSRLKLVGATLEYYIIIEHGVVKGRLPTESMEEVEWWFYPYFQIGNRNRGDGEKMMGKKDHFFGQRKSTDKGSGIQFHYRDHD